ncbi:hypothetical protein GCM10010172_09820 [Paractinoplanes ferrugineus]
MVSERLRADSRLSAGLAVSAVAKIHIASRATSGTVTMVMIFERIDQLRVLIRLRPRVGRLQDVTDRVRLGENT